MMYGYLRLSPTKTDEQEQKAMLEAFGCETFRPTPEDLADAESKAKARNAAPAKDKETPAEVDVLGVILKGLAIDDTLVVTDLSRLNHTPREFVKFASLFIKSNASFVSIEDKINLIKVNGEIKSGSEFFNICQTIEDSSNRLNYERVKTHLQNKKSTTETQKKINRFPSKDELDNPEKIKEALKPNLEKLAQAKKRIDAGESVRIVSKDLGINLSTLYRIIGAKPPPPEKLTAAIKAKRTQSKVNSEDQ